MDGDSGKVVNHTFLQNRQSHLSLDLSMRIRLFIVTLVVSRSLNEDTLNYFTITRLFRAHIFCERVSLTRQDRVATQRVFCPYHLAHF